MSAYMPPIRSWGLDAREPIRATIRSIRWIAVAGIAAASWAAVVSISRPGEPSRPVHLASGGPIVSRAVTVEREQGYIVVRGEAVNRSSRPARHLEALVELFDEAGALREVEGALVAMPLVAAGDESPFTVRMEDPGEVGSFRVRFRSLSASRAP